MYRRIVASTATTVTMIIATSALTLSLSATPALAIPLTDNPVIQAINPAGTSGLSTNEYAFWNSPSGTQSIDWDVNSGSLFSATTTDGSSVQAFHTGAIDNIAPNATSSNGTNSSVLRAITDTNTFTNVSLRLKTKLSTPTSTATTPAVDWDGLHLFMRYQGEDHLYYVSVARRDGAVVIKKKCPGGPSNGGTYHTLASTAANAYPISAGSWKWYAATIKTNASPAGSVTIDAWRSDVQILSFTDTGQDGDCDPITAAGRVGLRGDNTEFYAYNIRVREW